MQSRTSPKYPGTRNLEPGPGTKLEAEGIPGHQHQHQAEQSTRTQQTTNPDQGTRNQDPGTRAGTESRNHDQGAIEDAPGTRTEEPGPGAGAGGRTEHHHHHHHLADPEMTSHTRQSPTIQGAVARSVNCPVLNISVHKLTTKIPKGIKDTHLPPSQGQPASSQKETSHQEPG